VHRKNYPGEPPQEAPGGIRMAFRYRPTQDNRLRQQPGTC